MREYLLLALVTAAVTYLLVPPVRIFALRIGAAPEVRDRDVHKVPTPRLGGLAMFGGMAAGLLFAQHLPYVGVALADPQAGGGGQTVTALLVAGGLITLTGFLDDWLGMDAFVKLGGQVASAGLLVYFGMVLQWLPVPGSVVSFDMSTQAVLTIMVVVVTINAVNFVDGLDGLAAGIVGIGALATFTYSIALSWGSQESRINVTAAIAAILIGMCLGFLPHNFNPAKIFMGDTGAMLLGMLLGTSLITITSTNPLSDLNKFPVILPLLLPFAVLVLPLADLIMAVVRRTSVGLSPFAPDRGHLHHRLLDLGHSQRRSVLIMYAWTFLFSFLVVGLAIGGVPLYVLLLTVVLAIAILIALTRPSWRRGRRGGRGGAHAAGRPAPGEPGVGPGMGTAPPASQRASASTS
ncbi:undecaprenyl/decaprenyl-phosphate alpha-N-acetylglucosaminyl 1-phosphate transferase [Streptosporangiaceae bacterium NEAU-GS5]|nr:undecaprenyl/decaprenyl-phosphate alpha-N-acetylglucosaminyl 1-phosphate transferase [Streptosporangiaceae bacterium NEAU-GS5]